MVHLDQLLKFVLAFMHKHELIVELYEMHHSDSDLFDCIFLLQFCGESISSERLSLKANINNKIIIIFELLLSIYVLFYCTENLDITVNKVV